MNDYLNRVGRPAPVASGGLPAPVQQPAGGGSKKIKGRIDGLKLIFVIMLGAVAVLLIALVAYIVVYKTDVSVTSKVNKDQYQAVFLNSADGQVYFGKLKELNRNYYQLSDIYYVRVQTVQPDKNTTQTQQSISLAKLGNEIHGPEDVMYINKDSVMFWENLKADGQVVKAITEYVKNGATQATPTPNTSPTPTVKK
ncbi:MAG: hypothetical protein WCP03_00365 [Candidatus Saccharibacteria bacterium]